MWYVWGVLLCCDTLSSSTTCCAAPQYALWGNKTDLSLLVDASGINPVSAVEQGRAGEAACSQTATCEAFRATLGVHALWHAQA